MLKKSLLNLFIILLLCNIVSATEYYVCDNKADCNSGDGINWASVSDPSDTNSGTKAEPWKTLAYAEDHVLGGDTVIVGDGTYNTADPYYAYTVLWVNNAFSNMVTFKAENKWKAIISDKRYCVWIDESTRNFRMEDFEITNCPIVGINSKDDTDTTPYVRAKNIEFYRLKVHDVGHTGIAFQESDNGLIDSCLIYDLTSTSSYRNQYHGIYISDNTNNITIQNNIIYGVPEGWPIHIYDGHGRGDATNHKVLSNTLIDESPYRDGGLVLYGDNHIVRNNIMYTVVDSSYVGAINDRANGGVIENTLTNQPSLCNHGCAGVGLLGNILNADLSNEFIDHLNRDYSLKSNALSIDAGTTVDVNFDFAGNPRPQGSGFDIGAYEYLWGCTDDSQCSHLDSLCIKGTCDSGACIEQFTTDSCDDGYDCTENDICNDGLCGGVPNNALCSNNADCDSVTCTLSGCQYSDCGDCESIVLLLHFDKDSSITQDSSGYGNNGTVNGATFTTGRFNGAFEFDGIDDHILLGNAPILDFDTGSFTYSLWVKANPGVGNYDMPWWKGGSNIASKGYDLELGIGEWKTFLADGTTSVAGIFGNENEFVSKWAHLAGVVNREDNTFKVYANGIEKDSTSIVGLGSLTGNQIAYIGGYSNYPFTGSIDEIAIWTRPLTIDDIQNLQNNTINCQTSSCSNADIDSSGDVTLQELNLYLQEWKDHLVSMEALVQALKNWKNEC